MKLSLQKSVDTDKGSHRNSDDSTNNANNCCSVTSPLMYRKNQRSNADGRNLASTSTAANNKATGERRISLLISNDRQGSISEASTYLYHTDDDDDNKPGESLMKKQDDDNNQSSDNFENVDETERLKTSLPSLSTHHRESNALSVSECVVADNDSGGYRFQDKHIQPPDDHVCHHYHYHHYNTSNADNGAGTLVVFCDECGAASTLSQLPAFSQSLHEDRKIVQEACCRIIVVVVCVQAALGIVINCISLVLLCGSDILVDFVSAPIWAGIPLFLSGCNGFYLTSRRTVIKRSCSVSYTSLVLSHVLSLTAVAACLAAAILTGLHAARIQSYSQCIASSSSLASSTLILSPSAPAASSKLVVDKSPATIINRQESDGKNSTNNNTNANFTATPMPRQQQTAPPTTPRYPSPFEFTTRFPGEILCVCQQLLLNEGSSHGMVLHYYYGHNDCKSIFYILKDQLILICAFSSFGCVFSMWLILLMFRGEYATERQQQPSTRSAETSVRNFGTSYAYVTAGNNKNDKNNNNKEVASHHHRAAAAPTPVAIADPHHTPENKAAIISAAVVV